MPLSYPKLSLSERNALPRLRIHAAQFEALPEYALTRPTGIYIGKLWRSMTTCGSWIVFGYLACPTDATMCVIHAWKPFFTARRAPLIDEYRRMYEADVRGNRGDAQ